MMSPEELGRVAYLAYGATTEFKNYQGLPMPSWADLPDQIRRAWCNAAHAVMRQVTVTEPLRATFVDPRVVRECTSCGFLWPPGLTDTARRCPGCQQAYEG
ncbi:MAG: hypothetical protein H0U59_04175 [Gemmatimonadaceae bacterium]|nr:hypothetical protein [Gemmatimonadaceae bacterium]